jgi:hypothetical protein
MPTVPTIFTIYYPQGTVSSCLPVIRLVSPITIKSSIDDDSFIGVKEEGY